jgi:hypothetical protein
MSRYYDYEDYESIANDIDDLYEYDDHWDNDDAELENSYDWENYYHNITNEIVDE